MSARLQNTTARILLLLVLVAGLIVTLLAALGFQDTWKNKTHSLFTALTTRHRAADVCQTALLKLAEGGLWTSCYNIQSCGLTEGLYQGH